MRRLQKTLRKFGLLRTRSALKTAPCRLSFHTACFIKESSISSEFHHPFYPIGSYLTPPHVDGMGSQCGGFLQRARLQEWATSRAEEAGKGSDHSRSELGGVPLVCTYQRYQLTVHSQAMEARRRAEEVAVHLSLKTTQEVFKDLKSEMEKFQLVTLAWNSSC